MGVGSLDGRGMVIVNDEYVNKGKVTACVAWAGVVGFLGAAWLVMILSDERAWKYAGLLAWTGCALSAYAAVLHIRCFAVRVAGLVRAGHGVPPSERPRPVSHL